MQINWKELIAETSKRKYFLQVFIGEYDQMESDKLS